MPFGVQSEVGKLRKVMVHRPGLEHARLTPSNAEELLFDDVLWVERAEAEHDKFCQTMRDHGVEVVLAWRTNVTAEFGGGLEPAGHEFARAGVAHA